MLDCVWHMYLNCSGFSVASQNCVEALISQDFPIHIDKNDYMDRYNFEGISSKKLDNFHKLQYPKDSSNSLSIWQFPPDRLKTDAKINIGYTTCETTGISDLWKNKINSMDYIWTPSNFCKNVFENYGVKKPIKIIPHAIDEKLWQKSNTPFSIKGKRGFTFLFVSEWMPRKGIYELLEAWFSAFDSKDDVSLILKTYLGYEKNIDVIKREIADIRNNKFNLSQTQTAPIILINNFIKEDKMPQLFSAADVLIAPSLGEGFGMSIVQAQMMGLPVITTNWGAMKEVCNEEVGYMININGLKKVSNKQIYYIKDYKDTYWADLDIDDLIDKMKYVYNNSEKLKEKSSKAKKFAQKFNYNNIGKKITNNLNNILEDKYDYEEKEEIFFNKWTGEIGDGYSDILIIKLKNKNKISSNSFVDYFPNSRFLKVYYNATDYFWGKIK